MRGASLFLAVAFVVSGCGGGHGGSSSPGLIGAAGGALTVDDAQSSIRGSSVSVPANAVPLLTQFTLRAGTPVSRSNHQAVGPAVNAGPEGGTFAQPVLVTVPVTPPLPDGVTLQDLVVLKRDDATGTVTVLTPVSRDGAAGTLTVSVTSFSTFQGARLLPVDPYRSTVTVSPSSVTASGGAKATVTVTVRDTTGAPFPGRSVTLSSSGTNDTLVQPEGTTDANGVVAGTIASSTAETKTITATVNGVVLSQRPTLTFESPTATVTALSPASGPVSGGTNVTVTGTGFTGVTAVQFGTAATTSVTVTSPTQLVATAPARAALDAAVVDVRVVTAAGTSAVTSAGAFSYGVAFVQELGAASFASAAGGETSLHITTTAAAKAGDLVFIAFGMAGNANGTASFTDSSGNTYSTAFVNGVTGSRAIWLAKSKLTTALPVGGTLTVNLVSPLNAGDVVAATAFQFTNLTTGATDRVSSPNTGNPSGTSATTGTTAVTTQAHELVVGLFVAYDLSSGSAPTSFTPGAGYTALSGLSRTSSSKGVAVFPLYKTVNATGTQTATGTFGSASAHFGGVATFR